MATIEVTVINQHKEDSKAVFISQSKSNKPYLLYRYDKRFKGGKKYLTVIASLHYIDSKIYWLPRHKVGFFSLWHRPYDYRTEMLKEKFGIDLYSLPNYLERELY